MRKDGRYIGYIYIIRNTNNNKVYIGQTRSTIFKRFQDHIYASRSKTKKYISVLYYAMQKYGTDSFYVQELDSVYCNTEEELRMVLNEKEIFYISQYNSTVPNGYNISSGGANNVDTRRIKVCKVARNGDVLQIYECLQYAEEDNKLSHSAIRAALNGQGYAGGYFWVLYDDYESISVGDNIGTQSCSHYAPVWQFTLDGEYVANYESIASAERKTGIAHSKISSACNRDGLKYRDGTKTRLSAGGFLWSFTDQPPEYNSRQKTARMKRVRQLDKDGNEIKVYNSLSEAANGLNTNSSLIAQCCKGKRKTTGGFAWEYA